MKFIKRLPFIGISVSILAGIVSGMAIVGREASLPDVLTLFFSGFAGGASLVAFLRGKKN